MTGVATLVYQGFRCLVFPADLYYLLVSALVAMWLTEMGTESTLALLNL